MEEGEFGDVGCVCVGPKVGGRAARATKRQRAPCCLICSAIAGKCFSWMRVVQSTRSTRPCGAGFTRLRRGRIKGRRLTRHGHAPKQPPRLVITPPAIITPISHHPPRAPGPAPQRPCRCGRRSRGAAAGGRALQTRGSRRCGRLLVWGGGKRVWEGVTDGGSQMPSGWQQAAHTTPFETPPQAAPQLTVGVPRRKQLPDLQQRAAHPLQQQRVAERRHLDRGKPGARQRARRLDRALERPHVLVARRLVLVAVHAADHPLCTRQRARVGGRRRGRRRLGGRGGGRGGVAVAPLAAAGRLDVVLGRKVDDGADAVGLEEADRGPDVLLVLAGAAGGGGGVIRSRDQRGLAVRARERGLTNTRPGRQRRKKRPAEEPPRPCGRTKTA